MTPEQFLNQQDLSNRKLFTKADVIRFAELYHQEKVKQNKESIKACFNCKFKELTDEDEPCFECYYHNAKPNFEKK